MSIVPPTPRKKSTNPLAFTNDEKDLIILGCGQIMRTDANNITTTFSLNAYGDATYKYVLINQRILNGGNLDIGLLFNTHKDLLQSNYPYIYNMYMVIVSPNQSVIATTNYTVS